MFKTSNYSDLSLALIRTHKFLGRPKAEVKKNIIVLILAIIEIDFRWCAKRSVNAE